MKLREGNQGFNEIVRADENNEPHKDPHITCVRVKKKKREREEKRKSLKRRRVSRAVLSSFFSSLVSNLVVTA